MIVFKSTWMTSPHMMMEEVIILGQLLSAIGIPVDPSKVEVILNFLAPKPHVMQYSSRRSTKKTYFRLWMKNNPNSKNGC